MILYFTGTGNSRAVAERLGTSLDTRVERLMPSMAGHDSPSLNCKGESSIIWVFPVHSWGVPEIVRKIIAGIPLAGAERVIHHMVATCGDDSGFTDRMWRKEIEQRGWTSGSAFTVCMPNTYVSLPFFDVDSAKVADRKLSDMPARIAEIVSSIKNGVEKIDVIRGSFPGIKTDVIFPFFIRHLINPAKFKVSDACISCGKCVNICPMKNIALHDGHPLWGNECCGCLACYHVCPTHAINYGRFTQGKGQYYFNGIIGKA